MNSRIISPDNDFSAKAPFSIQEGRCREALAVFSFPCRRPGNSPTSSAPPTGRLCGCCTGWKSVRYCKMPHCRGPLLIGDLYGMLRGAVDRPAADCSTGPASVWRCICREVLPPVAAGH